MQPKLTTTHLFDRNELRIKVERVLGRRDREVADAVIERFLALSDAQRAAHLDAALRAMAEPGIAVYTHWDGEKLVSTPVDTRRDADG